MPPHLPTRLPETCGRCGGWVWHRINPCTCPEKTQMDGCASPGMAWRDIAASAYRAYAAVTGGKNFRGDPMPAFDALPPPIRTAWEAAVRQAGLCLDVRMGGAAPDESRWSGWTPPGV